jgi:hypothetical protein
MNLNGVAMVEINYLYLYLSVGRNQGVPSLKIVEYRGCIQRKKTWCMGPYARVDYNSPYLIVSSIVYPPPLHREGVEWGRSLLLVKHISICLLISKTIFYVKTRTEKVEKGVRAELVLI